MYVCMYICSYACTVVSCGEGKEHIKCTYSTVQFMRRTEQEINILVLKYHLKKDFKCLNVA